MNTWVAEDMTDVSCRQKEPDGEFFTVSVSVNADLQLYRVTHLLADLGWVDLDFGCSTGRWAVLQLRCCPSKWNIPNPSQPNPDLRGDGSPCTVLSHVSEFQH